MSFIKILKSTRGQVFITVMVISMLMILIAVAASNMLLQDTRMVKHLKYSAEAQHIAEAGINIALAGLADDFDLSVFPLSGSVGDGSYLVSVSQSGGRILLTSAGTLSGLGGGGGDVSRTVSAEVKQSTFSCMNYIMSAKTNLYLRAGFVSLTTINGKIHANNKTELRTGLFLGLMLISDTATYTNDTVSLDVYIGYIEVDGNSYWPGTHTTKPEWQSAALTFPEFDYDYYKQEAQDSGLYYSGDQSFSGTTLNPGNGLTYVEGTATFTGTCNVYGGIIAEEIYVRSSWGNRGKLYQHEKGEYNAVVARTGNIEIGNVDGWRRRAAEFHVEKALVYAENDFETLAAASIVYVDGVITASNVNLRDYIAYIDYDYAYPAVKFGPDVNQLELVSWNQ